MDACPDELLETLRELIEREPLSAECGASQEPDLEEEYQAELALEERLARARLVEKYGEDSVFRFERELGVASAVEEALQRRRPHVHRYEDVRIANAATALDELTVKMVDDLRAGGVPEEDLAQVDAILHPAWERDEANRPVRPNRLVCAPARDRARARSSCGGRRRPRRRVARAHAPPGSDSEGEPEPAGRHVARHSQGALA